MGSVTDDGSNPLTHTLPRLASHTLWDCHSIPVQLDTGARTVCPRHTSHIPHMSCKTGTRHWLYPYSPSHNLWIKDQAFTLYSLHIPVYTFEIYNWHIYAFSKNVFFTQILNVLMTVCFIRKKVSHFHTIVEITRTIYEYHNLLPAPVFELLDTVVAPANK